MIHWGWVIAIAVIMFYIGFFAMALFKVSKTDETVCRVCGCTDEQACEGGCYWVEPGLCSGCAKEMENLT